MPADGIGQVPLVEYCALLEVGEGIAYNMSCEGKHAERLANSVKQICNEISTSLARELFAGPNDRGGEGFCHAVRRHAECIPKVLRGNEKIQMIPT